jgi:hypothetical protein
MSDPLVLSSRSKTKQKREDGTQTTHCMKSRRRSMDLIYSVSSRRKTSLLSLFGSPLVFKHSPSGVALPSIPAREVHEGVAAARENSRDGGGATPAARATRRSLLQHPPPSVLPFSPVIASPSPSPLLSLARVCRSLGLGLSSSSGMKGARGFHLRRELVAPPD